MKMDGNAVFKIAVQKMTNVAKQLLPKNNITINDIDMVLFHQANIRILESVRRRLKLPSEKVYINVQKYGNTSAVTIAIAFDEVIKKGLIKKGSNVMMVAFGGGFTWGSLFLTL